MDDSLADEIVDGELREDDRARVKAELDTTERLLWLGRPIPTSDPLGRSFAVFAVLDAIAWVAAASCIITVGRQGWGNGDAAGAVVAALAVAGFLTLGLALFFLNRRLARVRLGGTLYALTDRRAIIWKPSPRPGSVEVHSVARGGVKRVYRVEYPDGSGDVIFHQPTEAEGYWTPPGFEKVPEVVRVERLVRESLLSAERT
jgi:hypothetical protein